MNRFVAAIYQRFLEGGELFAAARYLQVTSGENFTEKILVRLKMEYQPQTDTPWVDEALKAYWEYLRTVWYTLWQEQETDSDTPMPQQNVLAENAATLQRRLGAILAAPDKELKELETIFAERLTRLGYYVCFGTTGELYGPYIWQTETIEEQTVIMPHSMENVRVHFMDHFLFAGPFSILFDHYFAVSSWGNKEDLYCVAEIYRDVLTQPKFQISFLKHETQHQIDAYYLNLSPVHLEYRAKLVELHYYSDSSFLKFLMTAAGLATPHNHYTEAAAILLRDLQEYLAEVGVVDPVLFLEECLSKPLMWMKNRGMVQQAALAILDRDTRRILTKKQRQLPETLR
ncbi:hypothetical protein ACWOEH_11155 [Enterococcus nangangensis]